MEASHSMVGKPMASAEVGERTNGWVVRAILYWIPLALVVTVVVGLVYVTVQQNFRQTANDPQIQMAGMPLLSLRRASQPTP